jgi:DMSO/TMAO reductase YedYZ heme-binding membrane subunit
MGALDMKIPWVKKLMSIRKELSIISGFPILTHAIIRFNQGLNGFRFFTDNEAYMASGRATSALGAGISSFSFALGILMLALFLVLWVTSFDFVHKRMGGVAWKKLQRWSYVLYAMLFIHAMGIQAGGMLNPRGGRAPARTVEAVDPASAAPTEREHSAAFPTVEGQSGQREGGGERTRPARSETNTETREERGGRGNRNAVQPADSSNRSETAQPARGGRQQSTGFADIQVSPQTRRNIHIASLLLVFGSYLYLRLRKAGMSKAKRKSRTTDK